jgi:hypothetical protein
MLGAISADQLGLSVTTTTTYNVLCSIEILRRVDVSLMERIHHINY